MRPKLLTLAALAILAGLSLIFIAVAHAHQPMPVTPHVHSAVYARPHARPAYRT